MNTRIDAVCRISGLLRGRAGGRSPFDASAELRLLRFTKDERLPASADDDRGRSALYNATRGCARIDYHALFARGGRSGWRQRLIRPGAGELAPALERLNAGGSEGTILFVHHAAASGPVVMAVIRADGASSQECRSGGNEDRGEAGA